MFVLALRTDKPEAELHLIGEDANEATSHIWMADRELAGQLLGTIEHFLKQQAVAWNQLHGIGVYRGPGSFTGLRIGVTVANALAYCLNIPVVGVDGADWIAKGVRDVRHTQPGRYPVPQYGAPPHVTTARK